MKKNQLFIAGGIVGVSVLLFSFWPEEKDEAAIQNEWLFEEQQKPHEEETVSEILIVDVKGAVEKPGVYEANPNDRVIDIIQKAGGLMDEADETQVNFAMRVEDEMVLYIPTRGETSDMVSEALGGSQSKGEDKVNLNTASSAELETLSGVGPAKAAAIIEHRETNGPYKDIEDLKKISGIGDKTFEKLKDQIKVK
ncbi:helix-hairpin-helix domain-containing protein [Cytobacillus purgationiresistens]|uniref:Competence protein ComEA n=1 Tax=Cytobacillus purgationiresistens TaxID=863449 RepID=A0ABU0AGG8_9BACI|nr:helix-hairpin-helix domain-containing protein [Cytobacillus purgationiresistens]MDQ0269523.1 competence protein ComEA [Cytobacillus purgationiresistens]